LLISYSLAFPFLNYRLVEAVNSKLLHGENSMALKLQYYGQNDSQWSPDVTLTGDPGTDQQTLTSAGYLGGIVVAIKAPATYTAVEAVIVPCDNDSYIPFGTLINGPGEFAGAIGPSGSKKAPVVRALWQGNVNSEAYDAQSGVSWTLGGYVYVGGTGNSNIGKYTSSSKKGSLATVVGICTHVPSTSEPWLGVASLL